ncbi:lysylphosphatidylglycerol synthase transmembrane domain-containing protein [Thermodesulfobacteriota bacterium]
MQKSLVISLVLGIFLSSITLYFAFRNVPFGDLMHYLRSINYFWVIPSVGIFLVSFVLRVVRWQVILSSTRNIGFWRAFHPLMIGFMMNCVLPGRVGEMARPLILKKNDNVPFTTGLATVAAERIFDVSMIIFFFAAVLATVRIDPNLMINFGKYTLNRDTLFAISSGMLKMCILLVMGIVVISIERTRNLLAKAIMGIPRLFFFADTAFREKISEKVSKLLIRILENIAAGFSLVRHPGKISSCFALSFIIWSFQALSFYILAIGCPGIELSYLELFAVLIITCFFIALPSVPGFWGLWEAGGVFALSLFGVSSQNAAGFTLVNHVVQMFPVIFIGLASAMITGVNILQVSTQKMDANE